MRPARPFAPRKLSREDAFVARAFAARRRSVTVAGLTIDAVPPPIMVVDPVRLCLGAGLGVAIVPRALRDELLRRLDPAAPDADADAAALLLQLALEPALARLRALAPDLDPSLSAIAAADTGETDALGLSIDGVTGHAVRLELPREIASTVARALDSRPRTSASRWPSLTIPVRVRMLATDLPVSAARALRQGDVILADRLPDASVLLVAGERLLWRARRDDHAGGVRLTIETPMTAARAGLEGWMMANDTTQPPDAAPDATLDQLPIRLVFELGRLELPLSELVAIGPGHVFELTRDADQPLDIVAHGQRIGRGRIVSVGEDVGVQVVWINQPG